MNKSVVLITGGLTGIGARLPSRSPKRVPRWSLPAGATRLARSSSRSFALSGDEAGSSTPTSARS